jgi:predicted Rossmann-fold nucleotide-binding protein
MIHSIRVPFPESSHRETNIILPKEKEIITTALQAAIPDVNTRSNFINTISVEGEILRYNLPELRFPHIRRIIKHSLLDILRYSLLNKKNPTKATKQLYDFHPIQTNGLPVEVIQGGVSISNEQRKNLYNFYYNLDKAFFRILVTGSGPGTMDIPLAVRKEIIKQFFFEFGIDTCIGMSEVGILAKEITNSSVDILRISENIYQRMMKFLGPADLIRFHEGGAGTMQEMLTFLEIVFDEKNQNLHLPAHAVGMKGNDYMKIVEEFVYEFLGVSEEEISSKIEFFNDTDPKKPDEYILSLQEAYFGTRSQLQKGIFRNDIYYPETVLVPPDHSVEFLNTLKLEEKDSPKERMTKLNAIMNALVEYPIKQKIYPKGISIEGDRSLIQPVENLVNTMYKQKRIPGEKFIQFNSYVD